MNRQSNFIYTPEKNLLQYIDRDNNRNINFVASDVRELLNNKEKVDKWINNK